jgi:hypothetical protein
MAGARRRLAMAGIDPLAADLLAHAIERNEGASAFELAGRANALASLPTLIQAVRPDALVVGSSDGLELPAVCARFLAERAGGLVVVLLTPTLARAVRYPGELCLERPTPAEILAVLGPA